MAFSGALQGPSRKSHSSSCATTWLLLLPQVVLLLLLVLASPETATSRGVLQYGKTNPFQPSKAFFSTDQFPRLHRRLVTVKKVMAIPLSSSRGAAAAIKGAITEKNPTLSSAAKDAIAQVTASSYSGVPPLPPDSTSRVFRVQDFGAIADGTTDGGVAFNSALQAACNYSRTMGQPSLVLVGPAAAVFKVKRPITLTGPCGARVSFQVDATILFQSAASYPAASWYMGSTLMGCNYNGLISFLNLTSGLTIRGSGIIDGGGATFWPRPAELRPHLITILFVADLIIDGITLMNSPMYHLHVYSADGLWIRRYVTNSPDESPNTDSMKLIGIRDAVVENCTLHGGDDAVSIVARTSQTVHNVTVRHVLALSGHGISIGSLGGGGVHACVSDVNVHDITMGAMDNGLRIKSWQGAKGMAKNILFQNIRMFSTKNPIIFDQFYCDAKQPLFPCAVTADNVAFTGVVFSNIAGTSRDKSGIVMKCSATVPCSDIALRGINLTDFKSSKTKLKVTVSNVVESTILGTMVPSITASTINRPATAAQAAQIARMVGYCPAEST